MTRPSRRARTAAAARVMITLVALAMSACALPRWPVEGPMTSAWGVRWRGWLPSIHHGVDIAVPTGTPVRTMASGRVHFAGTQTGYGNVVWVDHGGAVLTIYAHLSEVHVRMGDPVDDGQILGLSGSSGNAAGAHLHFEILRWGRAEDPVRLLGGPPPIR